MSGSRTAILSVAVLLLASFWTFAGLGDRALWDDEASTALFARSVRLTGDTNAVLGRNVVAWGHGATLDRNLRNRYVSPLGFWLAAPFVGTEGDSAFRARLPFAACGLLAVALLLFWLHRDHAPPLRRMLFALGLAGQTALFVAFRQCRYYAVAVLLTVTAAFLWRHRRGRLREIAGLSGALVLLMAANYMAYVAAVLCLAVDWLFWERRHRPLAPRDWGVLLGGQLAVGLALAATFNPLRSNPWEYRAAEWLGDRVTLFLWNLRDLNRAEMAVGALMLAAPLLWLVGRRKRTAPPPSPWLLRGPVLIVTWSAATALVSPQPLATLHVAAVRYLTPVIPMALFVAVLVLERTAGGGAWPAGRRGWIAVVLAVLTFWSNVLHGGPWLAAPDRTLAMSAGLPPGSFRVTPGELLAEIRNPPPSATRDVAAWLDATVPAEQSVWVQPDFSVFPLMFHAPDHQYAWMLAEETETTRRLGLPPIHFAGRVPPDWIVVFGPAVRDVSGTLKEWEARGLHYEPVTRFDRWWYDLNRPALFWHAFREIRDFDRNTEAVYVWRRAPSTQKGPAG